MLTEGRSTVSTEYYYSRGASDVKQDGSGHDYDYDGEPDQRRDNRRRFVK